MAQYSPCRVQAIRSMPSSGCGSSSRLRTWAGTSRNSPDVSKDGSVFRLGLEVELNEPLERATHLGFGELPRPLPEILPGGAGGDKAVHAVHDPSLKQTCVLPQAPTLEALPRGIVASMWCPHQATCCSGGECCPAALAYGPVPAIKVYLQLLDVSGYFEYFLVL